MVNSILLTGFGAFGPHPTNPTSKIALNLQGELIAGHRVETIILPVDFKKAMERIDNAFEQQHWRLHLGLGLSAKRDKITPEKFALNCLHCPDRPDNIGRIFDEESIEPNGPLALMTTHPAGELVQELSSQGYDSELSTHAGTYVCNAVMYRALRQTTRLISPTPSGFMHIPADQSLKEDSRWSEEKLTDAVRYALKFLISNTRTKTFWDFFKI
jgi:pyroglutamyl-peptidase